jgi:hypothetical protein
MPSGSGFDTGTRLELTKSDGELLVFTTSFHHMDDNGSYSGWTDHTIKVRGSLLYGFRLALSGRNPDKFYDHLHEVFDSALRQEVVVTQE